MSEKRAVILGVTADIGRGIAERLLRDGWQVIGIGRSSERLAELCAVPGLSLHRCFIDDPADVKRLQGELQAGGVGWNLFVSSVGTTEPIGKFFDLPFEDWARSIETNFLAQLRVLHALWSLRDPEGPIDIMLMAGGGTNGPFRNYSAYCVAKIALIKMCELIDDEAPEANAFIIGPGYTRTRIHQETLRAGPLAAGDEYSKVSNYLKEQGTSIEDIYRHMHWCMQQGRSVTGGRNFSTVHDAWRDEGAALADSLRGSRDAFRLRRSQLEVDK